MKYVTDTHPLLWHLFDTPRRLGVAAAAALDAGAEGGAQIIVPALVVAEMVAIVERGRLSNVPISALLSELRRMQRSANYSFIALRPSLIIASYKLTVFSDLFDRLIVAEARRLKLPLITRDEAIRASGLVPLVWD